jgi:hypothetical protein
MGWFSECTIAIIDPSDNRQDNNEYSAKLQVITYDNSEFPNKEFIFHGKPRVRI